MADALSPAAQLVWRHDRDRFLSGLFAPPPIREALFALYAFNYEVARTREMVREPLLGRIRLQWWRDSIAAIYAGEPPRRHEVIAPLAAAIRTHGLSRAPFDRLIDAREADLDDAPPADLHALETYAEGTAVPLVLLTLEALGVRAPPVAEMGRHVGIAYALAGLLRAVPFHARGGRVYLPADLLAQHRIDPQRDLFEGRPMPALPMVAAAVADVARGHLAAARAGHRDVPRDALPALLPAVLATRTLDRLEKAGHDVFAPRLARRAGSDLISLAFAAWRGRY